MARHERAGVGYVVAKPNVLPAKTSLSHQPHQKASQAVVCTHTHTHTHTQMHTEIFMHANYTIVFATNACHILSRIQILSWMHSDSLEIHTLADTHQAGCAVN
ncbi:hypothetical protein AMECASPLE_008080 [Ameca splendens]|uniref:Uncharacterized protein n=1 Tax=Ameca splendens TaxID=208324 RepID=A0ABV1A8A6_9TELE